MAIADRLVDAIIDDNDGRPESVNSQLEREANTMREMMASGVDELTALRKIAEGAV